MKRINNVILTALTAGVASVFMSLPAQAAGPKFEVVERFDQSLYAQPVQMAFETAATFENFWRKHSVLPAPEIDFRRYQVLMVMAGERPTTGYGLCVERLEETAENVWVHLKASQPVGDTFLPQVNHYPGCVVKVPRQTKGFQFMAPKERIVTAQKNLALRTLSKISNSLVLEPRKVIIRDEAGYQELWRFHHPNQAEAPPVNFNEEMVVAVFLGEQSTGGYGITIDKITETPAGLQVKYSVNVPDPDDMVIQILTAPTHWVAIKKSDAPVTFSTND